MSENSDSCRQIPFQVMVSSLRVVEFHRSPINRAQSLWCGAPDLYLRGHSPKELRKAKQILQALFTDGGVLDEPSCHYIGEVQRIPSFWRQIMKKVPKILLGTAFFLFTVVASPLFAAQGQITEVNPSGVHGKVVILQADEGTEEVTFVNPRAFHNGYTPQVGDNVEVNVTKVGKKIILVTIKKSTKTTTKTTGSTTSN